MYAMKMGFEDSLDIIITDKAHELLLEHGGVVGLVAELTIQALNALLNISEELRYLFTHMVLQRFPFYW